MREYYQSVPLGQKDMNKIPGLALENPYEYKNSNNKLIHSSSFTDLLLSSKSKAEPLIWPNNEIQSAESRSFNIQINSKRNNSNAIIDRNNFNAIDFLLQE